jgi:hypothetical protein
LVQDHSNGGQISDGTLSKKRKERKNRSLTTFLEKLGSFRQKNEFVLPFRLLVFFSPQKERLAKKRLVPTVKGGYAIAHGC